MTHATLSSKGQITIPAVVRAALGVGTGDRVDFVEIEKGQFAMIAATHPVHKLKGIIAKPKKAISIEDMNAAILARGSLAR